MQSALTMNYLTCPGDSRQLAYPIHGLLFSWALKEILPNQKQKRKANRLVALA